MKHNDLAPKGIYSFGTDGKMLKNAVENGYYYAENGLAVSYLGLVQAADGNFYYVQAQGKVVTNNASFFVSNTNGLVAKGRYEFDENGVMRTHVSSAEELQDAVDKGGYIVLDGDIDPGDLGGLVIGG